MKDIRGFGVAPILYLLALIGIASGVLYTSYIQSLRGNIILTQSLGVVSDLDAADKTMAALSVVDASGAGICPPGFEEDKDCPKAVIGLREVPEKDERLPNLPEEFTGSITDFMTGSTTISSAIPVQVGVFGDETGIKQLDPWGRYYIVCRWRGWLSGTEEERRAYQIISAGADRIIETRCGEAAQGDDHSVMRDSAGITQRATVWQSTQGLIQHEGVNAEAAGTTLSFAGSGVRVDTRGNIYIPGDLIVKGKTVSYADEDSINAKIIETERLSADHIRAGSLEAERGVFTGDVTIGGTLRGNEGTFRRLKSTLIETDELKAGNGHFIGDVTVGGNLEGNSISGNNGTFIDELNAGSIRATGKIKGTRIESTDGVFSGTITSDEIRANRGYIGRVESTTIITTTITANNGSITTLTVDNLIVNGDIIGGNVDLTGDTGGIDGILPIAYGGTSANTAEGALDNLFSATGTGTALSIGRGGTGANTATDSLNNLFGGDTGAGVSIRSDRLPILHANTAAASALVNNRYNMFSVDQYGRISGYEYQEINNDRIEFEGGGAVIVDENGIIFMIGEDIKGRWTIEGMNLGTGDTARAIIDAGRDTEAIIVPIGLTEDRPEPPVVGMIRFNTELNMFEGYLGGGIGWSGLGVGTDEGGEVVVGKCGKADGTIVVTPPTANLCDSGALSIITPNRGAFTWSCFGSGGGAHASCLALRQENGKCGKTTTYDIDAETEATLCLEGRLADKSGSNPWTWTCRGTNGGTSITCSAVLIIDGACGAADSVSIHTAPDTALCSAGNATAVIQDGNTWKWGCTGINGGTTINTCSAPKMIDGACGSADGTNAYTEPTANMCTEGIQSEFSNTDPWTWTCDGINGGTDATCTVNKTVNGGCGTADGTSLYSAPFAGLCETGTDTEVIVGDTGWTWSCEGINAGTTVTCSANKKVDGTCGAADGTDAYTEPAAPEDLCSTGTATTVTFDENTWSWSCTGVNGGTDSSCSVSKSIDGDCEDFEEEEEGGETPVYGACGSANGVSASVAPTANLCSAGTETSAALDGETWKWTCEGIGGGTTANC
ncbi:MAG: hypothetical protein FWF23_04365, partial [Alphaproteobacteria bacterium]|nr:hypothetical protein [Alphaproteobacteria bacterium]